LHGSTESLGKTLMETEKASPSDSHQRKLPQRDIMCGILLWLTMEMLFCQGGMVADTVGRITALIKQMEKAFQYLMQVL
jgi:hypothetical protein